MGFLDVLRGRRDLKKPAPDRLFAMSTAYVTLEMSLELRTTARAAIVFQQLDTADFAQLARDMQDKLIAADRDLTAARAEIAALKSTMEKLNTELTQMKTNADRNASKK